ncbi:hypothetical protein ACFX2G_035239 [Malus domestica]
MESGYRLNQPQMPISTKGHAQEFGTILSNDKYESLEHRVVVNSKKERFSIPSFVNPAHHTIDKPLEELADEQNQAKYKPYNRGKFLSHRKLTDFKKNSAENMQLCHFRVSE